MGTRKVVGLEAVARAFSKETFCFAKAVPLFSKETFCFAKAVPLFCLLFCGEKSMRERFKITTSEVLMSEGKPSLPKNLVSLYFLELRNDRKSAY
ncbi:MAG: hypothetical protein COT46_03910 [Sulfurimonas sp. CG08_land_8_20_14_0_20_36_33]|nr:MAG: hypothetical protein AUJ81_02285 [Helicobacteraceae bacterium CG1_02_36_14]PIP10462.1 MAG: hypothetical protein COX50_05605 [Sulfurimonas sp. CG23_combo_of_CG06-09_8_20_14_all_36_33]PIS26091.1 MAG: hypothetical protein COT46_03910 [Sulfurimonas sp. CG08_land_8_20_14_0_20_36_33]PIU35978.1 MAG: hypothetical protein COT05_01100 [Sulfurimonas sp. CG07_land_8_20_14_0_80_36_56]PIV02780.1 MAG: hypothetical protein COS56_10680 [Sulfurimonas sp. CG03_land_8_20_14_0_80_36_25]PIV35731.1 MAG: hypo